MIVKAFAVQGEEVVEDMAQGEDGGTRIDRTGDGGKGAGLAAGRGCAFEDRDRKSGRSEADACGEAAHSGADHDGFGSLAFHGASLAGHRDMSKLDYMLCKI